MSNIQDNPELLSKIRGAEKHLSTLEVARFLVRSVRWVRDNKKRFDFERQNQKRNLKYELSSVIKVWLEIENENQEKTKRYRAAS